ncbi:uncharacterized protein LOC116305495 [Actinia tenebrosa]|uniref:Uncharacterized protein LOC116305495 n=1 Tax=Actinia tenebrosa TaxID=6105 RepID=A0A6P8IW78_ACTTE|nr:uncharacterized protein LOC116305495 [Actinia tenebrosa]
MNSRCYNCPAGGFFQDNIGHVLTTFDVFKGCKTCPPGTYVSIENAPGKSSLDCKKCPSGTKFSDFAGFRACKCLPGFYRTDRFGPCEKCPTDGVVCRNELIFLKPGFYWAWDSNPRKEAFRKLARNLEIEDDTYDINNTKYIGRLPPAYSCPVREACTGSIFSECSEGYTGVLCSVCVEGFHKSASLGCRKCSIGWISLQAVIILFFIISFATLVRKKKRRDKSGRSISEILMSQIKITIGFYQVSLGMIQSFSFIDWPENLNKYVEYANILQLNLFQVLPLHCLVPRFTFNPFYKMVMMILGNVFVIIVATIIYYFRKSRINKKDLPDEQKTAAISSAKETNYRFIIFFLFLTFPSTCTSIITVMPAACHEICSEQSCRWYLKADYGLKCFDSYYYNNYIQITLEVQHQNKAQRRSSSFPKE